MLTDKEIDTIIQTGAARDADGNLTGVGLYKFARAIEQEATAPLLARIAELEAKLAEARADAERYRWLRDRWGRVTETYDGGSGRVVEISTEPDGEGWDVDASSLDAAIDEALAKENSND